MLLEHTPLRLPSYDTPHQTHSFPPCHRCATSISLLGGGYLLCSEVPAVNVHKTIGLIIIFYVSFFNPSHMAGSFILTALLHRWAHPFSIFESPFDRFYLICQVEGVIYPTSMVLLLLYCTPAYYALTTYTANICTSFEPVSIFALPLSLVSFRILSGPFLGHLSWSPDGVRYLRNIYISYSSLYCQLLY